MEKHKVVYLQSSVPCKFSDLPAVVVTSEKGVEHLAVDRGYGFVANCDLSEESSEFLHSLDIS